MKCGALGNHGEHLGPDPLCVFGGSKTLAGDHNEPAAFNYKIAQQVDLTADAVNYRIKKMLDGNIIRKFTILVNLSALNYSWYTFSLSMKTFNNFYDAKFKQFIVTHPYILRAVKTLGTWDFLLYVVADSPRHFHSTVKEIKIHFAEIIRNHQTLLAYKEHLYVPLPKAVDITITMP